MRVLGDLFDDGMVHRFDNYVDGVWVGSDDYIANINPSDITDTIGEFARATTATAEMAVAAAVRAQPAWAELSPFRRFEILDWIGAEIIGNQKEIGRLLAREEGKTVAEATNEVNRAGALFKYFASESLRSHSESLVSARPGVAVQVQREPIGVVGLITPWNFPMSIPAWKTAPALACGNCVVLKPAELVPASAWALAEIISRSTMPAGVFNLVMGRGQDAGAAIASSPHVNGVSFTGSQAIGRQIGCGCAARGARFQLEMGGKNPLVILNDADISLAIRATIEGSYHSAGQRCTASSRLIVEDGICDAFVSRLTDVVGQLRVGHALDPETEIGPVVSKQQLDTSLSYLRIGVDDGAELAVGGELLKREHDGFYLQPALLVDTDNNMRINREEIFGPIASVIRADDYDHALSIANDTEYGLSAAIITTDRKNADDFKRRAQAGMVVVNGSTAGMDFHAPFTGRKGSSYGPPERGRFARDFYTAVRVIYD